MSSALKFKLCTFVCSRLNRQAEEAAARRAPANGFVGGIQNGDPGDFDEGQCNRLY